MNTSKNLQKSPAIIIKRSGSIVAFDETKIKNAVLRAMASVKQLDEKAALKITKAVTAKLWADIEKEELSIPTVEDVQDEVETQLVLHRLPEVAKAYILYRAERARTRPERTPVSPKVKELAEKSKSYFKDNPLGELVYLRTYARWIPEEGRRETWIETVDRYISFMEENLGNKLSAIEYDELREAILNQEVMPSMRLMQFAGEPARRCNTCAYNCTYTAPQKLTDFAEIMYLSMQGCGVGFSIESENVEQLPQIQKQRNGKLPNPHKVGDSKEGWCDALTLGLETWYVGKDIDFDYSDIRPAGARLKTMGGKASGPEPLRSLLQFSREKILARQGRRLRTIDVHDIICKIGECVVSGGVRRTAMISLSDIDDNDLRDAKKGQFYNTDPQRSIANNSAVYEYAPTNTELLEEWIALMKSGSGERGIFNRGTLASSLPERRKEYFKEKGILDKEGTIHTTIGTNPCGEIILQPKQFCNLSEVIARADDTKKSLLRKAKLASILGTYQSTLTKFKYISNEWTKNCEEERLLGVSITGQWDCPEARKPENLKALRKMAVDTNAEYAKRFGIPQSTSVTAVKPSGTVSQTFNCSSGIHPRHSSHYIRRIRISATDSLYKLLKDQGAPLKPEVGQTADNATTWVIEFPVESPKSAVFKDDQTAIEQLEYWKNIKLNYTEHNPSATISVSENEWVPVVNWLHEHWDVVGGLSFLPRFDHVYQLAPYEKIDKERYEEMKKDFPEIDYSKLIKYEHVDETEQKREFACVGGTCDIDMNVPSK